MIMMTLAVVLRGKLLFTTVILGAYQLASSNLITIQKVMVNSCREHIVQTQKLHVARDSADMHSEIQNHCSVCQQISWAKNNPGINSPKHEASKGMVRIGSHLSVISC